MTSLKFIQVGVGGWGASWLQIVKESKDCELVAMVDIDEKVLGEMSAQYPMDKKYCYTNLDAALADVPADALLCVTPPVVHEEVVVKALRAGLHVLTEKPLADTMEAAKRIVKESERTGKKLMVSQNYRFREQPRILHHLVAEQKLGQLGYAEVSFHIPLRSNHYRLNMEYPLLIDMSIHHFDMMRYILGVDALSVYSKSWQPRWSWFKGDPACALIIKMQNNIWVTYSASWVSTGKQTSWNSTWRIECAQGGLYWEDDEVFGLTKDGTQIDLPKLQLPLVDRPACLYEFAQAIKEDCQPECNGEDNLKSLAIVFAAIESARQDKEVNI